MQTVAVCAAALSFRCMGRNTAEGVPHPAGGFSGSGRTFDFPLKLQLATLRSRDRVLGSERQQAWRRLSQPLPEPRQSPAYGRGDWPLADRGKTLDAVSLTAVTAWLADWAAIWAPGTERLGDDPSVSELAAGI